MIFRNYLNMSILLVGAFLCIHFYEATVQEKLDAHNYVLKNIVDQQKDNIVTLPNNFLSYALCTKEELVETKKLKSDFESFKNAIDRPGELYKNTIQKLLYDYGMVSSLKGGSSNLSLIRQNHFYNRIEHQLTIIHEKLLERRRFIENNNIKVIIKDRAERYAFDDVHELDLRAVTLNLDFLGEENGSYRINGTDYPIQDYPIEFSSLPDSITFLLNGTDRVTGERYNMKERHSLNSKNLP